MLSALGLPDRVPLRKTLEEQSASPARAARRGAKRQPVDDAFLATVAHELRNQLGPALMSLEVIKRASADADVSARARATIERQLLHMKRLIEDLLDARRIASRHFGLEKERVDLKVVLAQAVETSRPALEATGLFLTSTGPRDPLFLEADPLRLTQVFANLLANAGKYTDPGGRITVALEQQGSDALVRVADNGIGIPPDLLAKVFDPFVQVDPSRRRAGGGLGIGLAVARQLVELHGGNISVQSEGVGRGSEFIVRLPLLGHRLLARDAAPVPAPPESRLACRILRVDDNRDAGGRSDVLWSYED